MYDWCGSLSVCWNELMLEKLFSVCYHKERRFTSTWWFVFGCLSVVRVAVLLRDGGAAAAAAPQLSPRYALIKRHCCGAKHEVSMWESMSVHVWEPVQGSRPWTGICSCDKQLNKSLLHQYNTVCPDSLDVQGASKQLALVKLWETSLGFTFLMLFSLIFLLSCSTGRHKYPARNQTKQLDCEFSSELETVFVWF